MPRDVKEYFETIATDFDSYYEQPTGFFDNILNVWLRRPGLLSRLQTSLLLSNPQKGKKILDIGCGSGKYVVECAKQGADVTGIDISAEMIQLAKEFCKKNNVNAHLQVGDATKDLPTDNDVTVALGVFEYFKNPTPLLKNMIAATKENGTILFSVPKLITFQYPLREILLHYRKVKCYYYTKKRIHTLITPFKQDIQKAEVHNCGPVLVISLELKKSAKNTKSH